MPPPPEARESIQVNTHISMNKLSKLKAVIRAYKKLKLLTRHVLGICEFCIIWHILEVRICVRCALTYWMNSCDIRHLHALFDNEPNVLPINYFLAFIYIF